MLDTVTKDMILKVIEEFTKEERIFTAFDVTKKVRANLGKVITLHDEFKDEVHKAYRSQEFPSNYIRILKPVGQSPRVWIYYIDWKNPHDYDPNDIPNVIVTDDLTSVNSHDFNKARLTTDNRLEVGKRFFKEIGAQKGSLIYLSCNKNGTKVILSLFPYTNGPNFGDQFHLIVNKDGRVRLSKKLIQDYLFGISIGKMFDIEINKDTVLVSPAK